MKCMNLSFLLNNCVSRKFPKFSAFWVPLRNCLAVSVVPPGDISISTQFLGFLMNCLAVMNTYQATWIIFCSILMFSCSRKILTRGKSCLNCLWLVRHHIPLNFVELAVKLDEIIWAYTRVWQIGILGILMFDVGIALISCTIRLWLENR